MTADELKAFCKENNLTYKELAEKIGMTEGSLKVAITTNKISDQTVAAIKLLQEIYDLQNQTKEFQSLKDILKNIVK